MTTSVVSWVGRWARSRFFWLLVVVVAAGIGANQWITAHGGSEAVVEDFGVWAPIVAWLLKTVTTMTPVGAVVMSLLIGGLFDFRLAIAMNLSSGVVGGIVMYYIWRRGDHEFDIQTRMRRLPHWFHRHAGDNLLFLLALRVLPWAGGSLADLIAGSHRVPMRTHILSLLLGYAPGAVIYTVLGAGLLGR